MKGSLLENLILNEFIKRDFNRGENRRPYYLQDNHGKKINCVIENGSSITAIEIKSGKTMSTSYFDNLIYWRSLIDSPENKEYVVYGGDQSMRINAGALVSWKDLNLIVD